MMRNINETDLSIKPGAKNSKDCSLAFERVINEDRFHNSKISTGSISQSKPYHSEKRLDVSRLEYRKFFSNADANTANLQARASDSLHLQDIPIMQINPLHISISSEAICRNGGRDNDADNELRCSIKAFGTNSEPILVRALIKSKDPATEYELFAGQRRLKICRELGFPVRAQVVDLPLIEILRCVSSSGVGALKHTIIDKGNWVYAQINEGRFKNAADLCEMAGWDKGSVSRALTLLELPESVVELFIYSKGIQHRHISPLNKMRKADIEGLLARAKIVKHENEKSGFSMSANEIFSALLPLHKTPLKKIENASKHAYQETSLQGEFLFSSTAYEPDSVGWRSNSKSSRPVIDDDGFDLADVFLDENGFACARYCFENLTEKDLDWLAFNMLELIESSLFYKRCKSEILEKDKM